MIEFRTIVGWLKGYRSIVKLSYGKQIVFYISAQIKENKHWATFTENEVYEVKE